MSPLGSFPLGAAPLGGGPLGQPGPVPGAPEGLRLRIGGNPDAAQYLFYRSWRLREQLLQWGHGISAVELVLTDTPVLLHLLAHDASACVHTRHHLHVEQRASPPLSK